MNKKYDTVIIGGGPAGLMAAKKLSEYSEQSFAIIEKSLDYSRSISCGEGVWKEPFENLLTPKDSWIRFNITKASFESNDDSQVILGNGSDTLGYIINRALMQEDLLNSIGDNGTLFRGLSVDSISVENEQSIINLSNGESISATTIIDSSGPSSSFSKSFGIYSKPEDLEPAIYAIVDNVDCDSSMLHLKMCSYFGAGGYAWEFPYDKTSVNIGIVIGRDYKGKINIKDRLIEFINKRFPKGKISKFRSGSIPCYTVHKKIASPGFIQCGDSANLVNPLTRSGISESMKSGIIAAEYAIKMNGAQTEELKSNIARDYEREIYNSYSKKIEKVAKVKSELYSISDDTFNNAAKELKSIDQDSITMLKILTVAIKKSPKVLWSMRHLL